jgi:hypothetical protein
VIGSCYQGQACFEDAAKRRALTVIGWIVTALVKAKGANGPAAAAAPVAHASRQRDDPAMSEVVDLSSDTRRSAGPVTRTGVVAVVRKGACAADSIVQPGGPVALGSGRARKSSSSRQRNHSADGVKRTFRSPELIVHRFRYAASRTRMTHV